MTLTGNLEASVNKFNKLRFFFKFYFYLVHLNWNSRSSRFGCQLDKSEQLGSISDCIVFWGQLTFKGGNVSLEIRGQELAHIFICMFIRLFGA